MARRRAIPRPIPTNVGASMTTYNFLIVPIAVAMVGCADHSTAARSSAPSANQAPTGVHMDPPHQTAHQVTDTAGTSSGTPPRAIPAEQKEAPLPTTVNWQERSSAMRPGMSRAEVESQLPPYLIGTNNTVEPVLEFPRAKSSTLIYPLDEHFQATIDYAIGQNGAYALSAVKITPLPQAR